MALTESKPKHLPFNNFVEDADHLQVLARDLDLDFAVLGDASSFLSSSNSDFNDCSR